MKLDKYDNLMIRACKDNGNTIRRLRKIWRHRCLLPKEYNYDDGIAYRLLELLNGRKKGFVFREWIELVNNLNPRGIRAIVFTDDMTYTEKVIELAAGQLAISSVDEWEGYISPLKFRNLKKQKRLLTY